MKEKLHSLAKEEQNQFLNRIMFHGSSTGNELLFILLLDQLIHLLYVIFFFLIRKEEPKGRTKIHTILS